jgi:hypothetical protein
MTVAARIQVMKGVVSDLGLELDNEKYICVYICVLA